MTVDGVRERTAARGRRRAALLMAVLLPLPLLAGCESGDADAGGSAVPQDVAATARGLVRDGGTANWAVDALPATLNTFQADADAAGDRVADAVLPALFTVDRRGRPQRNPDYLSSAEVTEREPRQVVVYRLNPDAVWTDGRPLEAADFRAQWQALSGRNQAFWTARNAGYDRIAGVERGKDAHEVRVTFRKPYADWQSLFAPLYPKSVMGTPEAFNDQARTGLAATAGPFALRGRDERAGTVTLVRNPRWWGDRAKLDRLVLRAVPADRRLAALEARRIDLADLGAPAAREFQDAARRTAGRTSPLGGYELRKSLAPSYTQLALNGEEGPLADERVRRAVARAIDRQDIASAVLKPLGLPAKPLGSHLMMAGQQGYRDNSAALGDRDPEAARALLTDAGWQEGDDTVGAAGETDSKRERGAPGREAAGEATRGQGPADPGAAGREAPEQGGAHEETGRSAADRQAPGQGAPGRDAAGRDTADGEAAGHRTAAGEAAGQEAPGRAPGDRDAAADGRAKAGGAPLLRKGGDPLTLRFVLPASPGTEPLREVGARISRALADIGIRAELDEVDDAAYFKDHIASGDYDLALYSWPATAYPATDARPVFAKPEPAPDGTLLVEQNYTRVGTDRIDQLFDQASAELDGAASRELMRRADARIWAAAGSVPLYQRPQLVAARKGLVNAGAFGYAGPRYQDIGFRK